MKAINSKSTPLHGASFANLEPAPAKKSAAAKKTSATQSAQAADGVDKGHAPSKTKAAANVAKTEATTFPGIHERFPIDDLSQIDGTGKVGSKFLLDGGSLQGLQLQMRRVKDGDAPGFEMMLKLTEARLPALIEALDKAGAGHGPMLYRDTHVEADGVVRYGSVSTKVSPSSTYAPPTNNNANKWVRTLEGPNGSRIEVVADDAAKAIRGLVRISLRGTDAACTTQLKAWVKSLGLEALFAPPTDNTKERLKLMRVLWQHDHAAAEKLAKKGLDKVKPAELREKLGKLGFSEARLDALEWREVFPGHFTAIDPQQMRDMQNAGARYLYSTVESPEHVHAILRGGQQSSSRRFQEGTIVEGMSSNADFSSGGAVGVFTRLVTQEAIWNGKAWIGRTYKVILKPEILARTDWFGWAGDQFGQSWDLDSKKNFGPGLVEHIDSKENGDFVDNNELIFRTGNSPDYIAAIVTPDAQAREKLVALLKAKGYTPPGGLSVEDFVRHEEKFFQFGEPEAPADPEAFLKDAWERAKAGDLYGLRRVLSGAPFEPSVQAEVEHTMLTSKSAPMREMAMKAIKVRGAFAMSTAAMEALLTELSKAKAEYKKEMFQTFMGDLTAAVVASDSDVALALLKEAQGEDGPTEGFGYGGASWPDVLGKLLERNAGKPHSAMLKWVLPQAIEEMLQYDITPALPLFAKHSLVSLSDAELKEKWTALKESGDGWGSPDVMLRAHLLSIKDPAALAPVVDKLFSIGNRQAGALVNDLMAKHGELGLSPEIMAKKLNGKLKGDEAGGFVEILFESHLLKWLKPGNEALAPVLSKVIEKSHPHIDLNELKASFAGHESSPLFKLGLRAMSDQLAYSYDTSDDDLRSFLRKTPLYEVGDQDAFIDEALKLHKSDPKEMHLRLCWLLTKPDGVALDLQQAFDKIFRSSARQPYGDPIVASLKWLIDRKEKPLSDEFVIEFIEQPAAKNKKVGSAKNELAKLYQPLLLASTNPKIITLWKKLHAGHELSIDLRNDFLPAYKALKAAPGAAAEKARLGLLEALKDTLVSNSDNEAAAELMAAGLTPGELGVDQDALTKAVLQFANYNSYMMASWPTQLSFLMNGPDGALDPALTEAVIDQLESVQSWGREKFIDAFLTVVPASLKVKLLKRRKELVTDE